MKIKYRANHWQNWAFKLRILILPKFKDLLKHPIEFQTQESMCVYMETARNKHLLNSNKNSVLVANMQVLIKK